MSDENYKVLLIEDNPLNIKLIEELLWCDDNEENNKKIFNVTSCKDIKTATQKLNQNQFDVILLDLLLPDSEGLNTLTTIRELANNIPIVIQTASNDETLMVKCFQMGVHGYLRKINLDRNILIYAIELAFQRQGYIDQVKAIEQQKQQEVEIKGLEQFNNSFASTNITSRMFGSQPIRESIPDIFQELVEDYGKLLDLALEQNAYRVEHNINEQLISLAEKLGFFKATPRDVVAIHTNALKLKNKNVLPAKAQAYIVEGRLMVLELMGYLTSYYRKYYIGLSNINMTFNNYEQ